MPWRDWLIAALVGVLVAVTVGALWGRSDS